MILQDQEVILNGNLSFNTDVKFTIFKADENDRYSFINVTDGNKYAEHSFNDFETLNLLKALKNNDFEALNKINSSISKAVKSFYNFTFLNDDVISQICKILNITLGNHEKELYNQDFMDTRDDLFTFSNKTFNNNWFYCLQHIEPFNADTTEQDMIQAIVQYYMTVFIECCIECECDNVADLYK